MAENSAYFEAVTAQRAMLLTEEEALEGTTTISLETQKDMSEDDVLTYIEHNLADFIQVLRFLSKEDQELLLSYYLLAKTQNTLAVIHRTTQTLCSFLIRMAVERIGTFFLLGSPTEATISEVLVRNGLEETLETVNLSKVIVLYDRTRSFQKVSDAFNLHRPDIRRAMRRASQKLSASNDSKSKALGAYIQGLIEKASARGKGLSKRKIAKSGHIYKVDSGLLGQFRVDIMHPEFEQVFTSRANR